MRTKEHTTTAKIGARMQASAIALALSAMAVALPAQALEAKPVPIDISAQPLGEALIQLARQANVDISAPSRLTQAKSAPAVSGTLSPREALDRLLAGSGLTVRVVRSDSFAIEGLPGEFGAGQGPAESAGAELEPEEIVVTGSHIRGVEAPVGSQLITIDREEINRAGYTSARDIAEKLPQNFAGGATGERQPNNAQADNTTHGSTINLRGLDSVATLVLLNGRRLPAGGINGHVTDISIIPFSAIERIEVLPDGASAVYGSDAVAGVVNFILRRNFSGLETTARIGTARNGSPDNLQISQTAGQNWTNGNVLIAYEYSSEGALRATDRPFTRSYDLRPFGGQDHRTVFANPGNIINAATGEVLFAIPSGQNGSNLLVGDLLPPEQRNLNDPAPGLDLLPKQRRHSAYVALRQDITESISAYVDARFTHRKTAFRGGATQLNLSVPSSNPFYIDVFGTGEAINIAYAVPIEGGTRTEKSITKSYGAGAGATIKHSHSWETNFNISYAADDGTQNVEGYLETEKLTEALNQSDPKLAFNPFGEGPISNEALMQELIHSVKLWSIRPKTLQGQVVTNGSLGEVFGNKIRAAIGFDGRQEVFKSNFFGSTRSERHFKRNVGAIFGELNVPLATEDSNIPGLYSFVVSASARYERYDDSIVKPAIEDPGSKSTTNPRIGLSWSPVKMLELKASYGTSFRAPSLSALAQSPSLFSLPAPDPLSPTGRTYTVVISGAQPNLTHETAETWTLGGTLRIPLPGNAIIQANYFNISFKGMITTPTFDLGNPDLTPLISRNPTIAQVQELCRAFSSARNFLGPEDCNTPGLVGAIFDLRTANYAQTHIDGFDFNIGTSFSTADLGRISAHINGTHIIHYKQALHRGAPLVDNVDKPQYPVDFRARANFTWQPLQPLVLAAYLNYTDGYRDPFSRQRIKSWTTIDATVTYNMRLKQSKIGPDELSVQISASNLFDKDPPYYENTRTSSAYDPTNSDPLGRQVSLSVTARW